MKKFCALFLLLIIPLSLSADIRIGPAAFYNFPLIQEEELDVPEPETLDISDFTFGADFRLKFGPLHGSAMALFTPGTKMVSSTGSSVQIPASVDVFLDGGVALDITKIRLGLGAGPNFTFFFGDSQYVGKPVSAGINVKASADLILGRFSIGGMYLMQFDFALSEIDKVLSADKTKGLFGIVILFKQ